jgi:glutamine amidotransferase
MRSPLTALGDVLFHRLSGVVSSETVLAHVRTATHGAVSVVNCHPFQHGRWVFAHNGSIGGYPACREALLAKVAPALRRFVLGDTDSEVIFFLFLTELARFRPLARRQPAEDVADALRSALRLVRRIACESSSDPSLLTVIATDGDTMVAAQGGRELHWSTHKTRCADRDRCPSLSPECEALSTSGYVNHLLLSSEPIQGENVWHALEPGEMVGVDWRMRLLREHVDQPRIAALTA